MFDKPHAKQSMGIELDGALLKSVALSLVKGKAVIDQFFAIAIDQSAEHVKPLDTTEEGQHFLKAAKKNLIVSALDSDEVLIRTLDVKLKKERDIDSVLAFQAEPLLPYPVENAVLDRMTASQNPEGTQLTLIAARKDHVKQHLDRLETLELAPDVVSCVPVALAFFSKLATTTDKPHFILHLGKRQITCALVKDGKLLAAQTSPFGIDALAKNLPLGAEIDFTNLSQREYPALFDSVEELRRDITRLLYALSKQVRDQEAGELLITGEGAVIPTLGEALSRDLQKQIILPAQDAFGYPAVQVLRFAVPIGAGLSALENVKDQINFRQQEYVHPQPWRHLKQPIALYFMLCIGLAAAFYIFGKANISQQKDALRQEYVDLLGTMNKSYDSFEKEYESKHPRDEGEEGIIAAEKLTPEDISQRIQLLQKELKDSPDTFPLLPNTPRVSDLLAWISTHPNVTGATKENGTPAQPLIQVESLSYTMVKRPEAKKKQEKYQVKVELEFSTPTPKYAREFHDALIAPNDFVDPKGEVKWSTNRGKYKATFFLKDRTAYPSTVASEG